MKILAAGGGSGGHVTPVVAVFRELNKLQPSSEIQFWCDKKFAPQAKQIMRDYDASIAVRTVVSGKFRRYHQLAWWKQLFRFRDIVGPNLRDGIYTIVGFFQSFGRLIIWRPDVVFCKGGFVCLPVGLAAWTLHIPLVIHDSDAHPGLTNRLLSRFATSIATGAPLKYYSYPLGVTRYVGIPVRAEFHQYSPREQSDFKRRFGFDGDKPLVVVTGGGLGAVRLNNAVMAVLGNLLPLTSVILISGTAQYDELAAKAPSDEHFQLHAFISDGMAETLAAADIVVARAGATSLLELAALARPTILVPNGYLAGGHQLKNAKVYADGGAVEVIDEHKLDASPGLLTEKIEQLLQDKARLRQLSENMAAFAKPAAAHDMAAMVLSAASRGAIQ